MRVTFDTNTLDKACRPERAPRDPQQAAFLKVNEALRKGRVQGFFPVTILTIEGIAKTDRADVYAGTKIVTRSEVSTRDSAADIPQAILDAVDGPVSTTSVTIKMEATQPGRKSLHPEVVRRMNAAKALGLKALKAVPRIGAFNLTDEDDEWYLKVSDGELSRWLDKAHEVGRAIEDRGVGYAQAVAVGRRLAGGASKTWYKALVDAIDVHQRRAVERAFSEWSDGDALASHIAYGIDVFCTADRGNSNAGPSVLDGGNRAWLASEYGVWFMTIEEVAASLDGL